MGYEVYGILHVAEAVNAAPALDKYEAAAEVCGTCSQVSNNFTYLT